MVLNIFQRVQQVVAAGQEAKDFVAAARAVAVAGKYMMFLYGQQDSLQLNRPYISFGH